MPNRCEHVKRMDAATCVSACRELIVLGVRCRGRGRENRQECVDIVLRGMWLKREDSQDRAAWRRVVSRHPMSLRARKHK